MEIISKILGKVEFSEENVIRFEEGLIGIPDKNKFILIEKEDFHPFSYLQSVDDPSFILVVISPMMVVKKYNFNIYKEDLNTIGIKDERDFSLLAIVIFAKNPQDITVNLKAPILINIHSKKALQIILQNDDYTVEEPLMKYLPEKMGAKKENKKNKKNTEKDIQDGKDIFKTK
ncbi:MAG: flagellar assembly protein FliW [bacterium]|nr:flagellar assembly protein FliW [bacterium]